MNEEIVPANISVRAYAFIGNDNAIPAPLKIAEFACLIFADEKYCVVDWVINGRDADKVKVPVLVYPAHVEIQSFDAPPIDVILKRFHQAALNFRRHSSVKFVVSGRNTLVFLVEESQSFREHEYFILVHSLSCRVKRIILVDGNNFPPDDFSCVDFSADDVRCNSDGFILSYCPLERVEAPHERNIARVRVDDCASFDYVLGNYSGSAHEKRDVLIRWEVVIAFGEHEVITE